MPSVLIPFSFPKHLLLLLLASPPPPSRGRGCHGGWRDGAEEAEGVRRLGHQEPAAQGGEAAAPPRRRQGRHEEALGIRQGKELGFLRMHIRLKARMALHDSLLSGAGDHRRPSRNPLSYHVGAQSGSDPPLSASPSPPTWPSFRKHIQVMKVKLAQWPSTCSKGMYVFWLMDLSRNAYMCEEHYMEEALKMRNLLEEFLKKHDGVRYPSILGVREHIFTGSVSSLSWFMFSGET